MKKIKRTTCVKSFQKILVIIAPLSLLEISIISVPAKDNCGVTSPSIVYPGGETFSDLPSNRELSIVVSGDGNGIPAIRADYIAAQMSAAGGILRGCNVDDRIIFQLRSYRAIEATHRLI